MKERQNKPRSFRLLAVAALLLLAGAAVWAQAPSRIIGTITAISGNSITVHTDAGQMQQVTVADGAAIKRVEPGQSLASATAIQLTDLAVNDRVLVRLDTASNPPQASMILAIKHSDLAQKQQKEREAWQEGVAGLVKSIDPTKTSIVVTTGAGPALKVETVQLTKSTVLLRYAPNSVSFADAKPAPVDAIKRGDQLRARGSYNTSHTLLTADEVVSGTFRNISGLVTSVDAAGKTLVVKDLATKKPVTVHVASDVQMRRLPERMAQMIAFRLKGGAMAERGGGAAGGDHAARNPEAGQGGGGHWSMGQNPGGGPGGHAGGDVSRVLSFAPVIQMSDLKKGDAVMIVATDGGAEVNAITLVAGVEPLLEAPQATDLLSNWSMGGGGADAAAGPQ